MVEGAESMARKTAEATSPPVPERTTRTGVPLRVIEGARSAEATPKDTVARSEMPIEQTPVSAAEGRLATAFRSAGEVALRWGRKGLIVLDGHRINMATKSLDGMNATMQSARSGGDATTESRLMGEIAGQLGEIERLSNRRMKTAAEVKKYYDGKLQAPNKMIERGEALLNGTKIEGGGAEPGLNDEIRISDGKIKEWNAKKEALSGEFAKLLDSSQLDAAAKAIKAQEMATEMKRLDGNIVHEQGNLDAKKNVAKSIQDKIDAYKTAYGGVYAKLDKYSGISQDGRSGTEAALLRARQESTRSVTEQPSTIAQITQPVPPQATPSVASDSPEGPKKIDTPDNPSEVTTEDLLRGLRELVNEEIRSSLERIVMSVGGKTMNDTKIKPAEFARMWNRAREKNGELPEIKSDHITKLGSEDGTLAQFGVLFLQNDDVKISKEVLEMGIKGSAEAWLELSKKKR